jgi:hypothetical protein
MATQREEAGHVASIHPSGNGRQQGVRYVCIPGSPFTGSTLLGTLLNEHSQIASIGAAVGLLPRADLATYRCSCGALFRECDFWIDVAGRTKELGHPVNVFEANFWNTHLRLSDNRLVNAALVRSLGSTPLNIARDAVVGRVSRVKNAVAEMTWNTWSLAKAILDRTGKSVFVDTARDHQRPKYLAGHPLLELRVIHLIRDPRGNSASIMKHTGADVATAARQWRHYNVEADRVRRYVSPEAWMTLRYEDLCADPEGVLDRIATFVGAGPAMSSPGPRGVDRHIIGNAMRLKGPREIREDRSWESRLGRADVQLIARIAGPTSRRLGVGWP